MRKFASFFLVLLLLLATASVASADLLDPYGRRPQRPRQPPEPVVESPRTPQVEVTAHREGTMTDGRNKLLLRFTLPDPGTYSYTIYEKETLEAVKTGEGENTSGKSMAFGASFFYPPIPGGEVARYILEADFSLYPWENTPFGRKRRTEPQETQIVRLLIVQDTCDGPTVSVLDDIP